MDPQALFDRNMSLVPFIYSKKFYEYTDHKEDLIQEGYMALWRSCLNFDELKGFKFSTYACTSIYRKMLEYTQLNIQKHSGVVSIDSVIAEDGEGNELYIKDTLSNNREDFNRYAIQEALLRVSERDRSIVCKLMEGYTQNQIAEMHNISQASVSRCLHKFRTILLEEYKNA
jgi:RNA polymerase sigma factor (sigma-70 family)